MKKLLLNLILPLLFVVPTTLRAQDSLQINFGADIVSRFIWRGMDSGQGVSFQPSLAFSYKGLCLEAWSSESFQDLSLKEFDLMLSYNIGGLTLTLSDYFWAGDSVSYSDFQENHHPEATLSYDFDPVPLELSWSTFLFAGKDVEIDEDDDRVYSSFFSLSSHFDVRGVEFTPTLGFTPWRGMYYDKFGVMEVSLKASKDLQITDHFSLPIFSLVSVSPALQRTYLVFGLSINI